MSNTHAHAVAFVRTETVPQSAPPSNASGPVKWVKENLFAGVGNSILTVAALLIVYLILVNSMPWILNGVWTAPSLSTCRGILDGASGACFAVLSERWNQLLFGFNYPTDQYWRPNIVFVLLFIAIAPVLFFDLPRKLLAFTAIFPFLAFWLIWGGAFWLPLLVMVGFVISIIAYKMARDRFGDSPALIVGIVTFLIWFGLLLGTINNTIDRTLGAARMDTKLAQLEQFETDTPVQIAALEAEREDLIADIADIIAPAADENDPSPAVIRETAKLAAGPRWELRKVTRKLSGLSSDLSDSKNLSNRIRGLEELEAGLPMLQENARSLRANLSPAVAEIVTVDGLNRLQDRNRSENLDIPPSDFDAVEDAMKAEEEVISAERTVEWTYADVARIGLEPVSSRNLGGFMLNMMLGVTCVALSIPLGIALALGRQSSMPFVKYVCVVFIEFIRGVPLITLLFVASVMLSYFFPPGSGVDLFIRVVIMITLFSSAYIAEVIRGGLAALPKGQFEAADSLGLDYAQATRLIILPQALKISIPGIVNIAVGLFKDTTLVSVISMFDMVGMIRGPILASTDWNGVYWELFGFAALLFFVVCYGISQYSQWLERRLATDHR